MAADSENENNGVRKYEMLLPVSRVRTIMKSSPDVENISQDAITAITAATELFIKDLTHRVHATSNDAGSITYNDVAALVNDEDAYGFLDEMVPKKVSGREILRQRQGENKLSDSEELNTEPTEAGDG